MQLYNYYNFNEPGIFTKIKEMKKIDFDYIDEKVAKSLDIALLSKYGRMCASDVVDFLYQTNDRENATEILAGMLLGIFESDWQRQHSALFEEVYSLANNYDLTEELTCNTASDTATESSTTGTTETISESAGSTENTQATQQTTAETSKVFGYNSVVGVDDSKTDIINTNSGSVLREENSSGSVAQENTSNTTGTEATTTTNTHTLRRFGNIGVMTTSQIIQHELDLRKTKFAEIMLEDVRKYLTNGNF